MDTRTQVVWRGIADQCRPDPLARSNFTVAAGGAEHGGQTGEEWARDAAAGPHIAPASIPQFGKPGDHIRIFEVAVEYLDCRTVPAAVQVVQHLRRGQMIHFPRYSFGNSQFVTHWEIEFLRVTGGDAQAAPLGLQHHEPICRRPQLRTMRHDQSVHGRSHLGGQHRSREWRIATQSQDQRIENPFHGPTQWSAVVGAEHLHTVADCAPGPVDHGTARQRRAHRDGALGGCRPYAHRDKDNRRGQLESWVR